MRSNSSIRLGIALMGGAFLLLIIYLLWRFQSPAPTTVVNTAPADGVTPVSMQSGRRTAVALVDMPERSIITPEMFRMEELPEGAANANYISDPAAQANGFITRRRVLRNERIRTTDLVGHISEVGIAGALSPGTRAMIVPIPSKPTFHDLVRVGGYVDVIAAFDQQESRTIVENVRVLAVDVFGNDYPPASVAMRGPYKAPPRAIRKIDPPSPSQAGEPNAEGTPTPPAGQLAAAPTPTPTPAAAPATPAPAITIEVTPEQANRISLAQNSGGVLDFILVPRPSFVVPGAIAPTDVRVATVTRAQLAPYAESRKKGPSSQERATNTMTRSLDRNMDKLTGAIVTAGANDSGSTGFGPTFPEPAPPRGQDLPPAGVKPAPAPRQTYEIPIYADGTKIRTDVVLKPAE